MGDVLISLHRIKCGERSGDVKILVIFCEYVVH